MGRCVRHSVGPFSPKGTQERAGSVRTRRTTASTIVRQDPPLESIVHADAVSGALGLELGSLRLDRRPIPSFL